MKIHNLQTKMFYNIEPGVILSIVLFYCYAVLCYAEWRGAFYANRGCNKKCFYGQVCKANFIEKLRLSPAMSLFLNNEVTSHIAELLLSTLRGPPSE